MLYLKFIQCGHPVNTMGSFAVAFLLQLGEHTGRARGNQLHVQVARE